MAGKPKAGLDYAGWSVDLFDGDTKIDKLLDAQGWVGFGVYFYLCQMAYKFDGYFYRWCFDDASTTARRMGGGLRAKTVEETVRYCLRVGLFDKGLHDRWNILTSRGIQKRFCQAVSGRRVKSVISEFWLLSDEESKGFEKCAQNQENRQKNDDLQAANSHLRLANDYKSKVKESKEKKKEEKEKPSDEPDDGFDAFWTAYPVKTGIIEQAYREYLQALNDGATPEQIMAGLRRHKPIWAEQGTRYTPAAAKWLHNKGWTAEIKEESKNGNQQHRRADRKTEGKIADEQWGIVYSNT